MMSMNPSRRKSLLRQASLLLAGAVVVAGCTVQPLNAPDPAFSGDPTLRQVAIGPVDTRVAQQVRNRLIFLLQGGQSPTAPAFDADLNVTSSARDLLRVQAPASGVNVTARRVTVTATVRLTRLSDGVVFVDEARSATAAFDNTRQEFANERALRDAEDRAARAVAEQLRIVIAAAVSSL